MNNTNYVYVGNYPDNTVTMYEVGAGGALVPLTPADISLNINHPQSITTVLIGSTTYAYVANLNSDTISIYTVGLNGQLEAQGSAENINAPMTMVTVKEQGVNYLYLVDDSTPTVKMYAIDDTTGQLTYIGEIGSPSGYTLATLVINNKNYVYSDGNNNIEQYEVGISGQLITLGSVPTGKGDANQLTAVTINNVNYLYATYNDNTIDRYQIDETGHLTFPESQVSVGNGPYQLSVLYVGPPAPIEWTPSYGNLTNAEALRLLSESLGAFF
jgi:6-phosphogluconolactonase (cycloisomerase 2 family)